MLLNRKKSGENIFLGWFQLYCFPRIAVDCGQLMPPVNGLVDTTGGTVFEREAVYSCREGYEVNGPTTRQCLASGQWNGMEPTCSCEYGVVQRASAFSSDERFSVATVVRLGTHTRDTVFSSAQISSMSVWSLCCAYGVCSAHYTPKTHTSKVCSLINYSSDLQTLLGNENCTFCLHYLAIKPYSGGLWQLGPPTEGEGVLVWYNVWFPGQLLV